MAKFDAMSRRSLVRLAAGTGLSFAGVSGLQREAAAGIAWCRACTMIELDGKMLTLFFDSSDDVLQVASHPIELIVRYPASAKSPARLEPMDNGFGQGYLVTLRPDPTLSVVGGRNQISVSTRVLARHASLPLYVEATRSEGDRAGKSYGSANAWVECPSLWL